MSNAVLNQSDAIALTDYPLSEDQIREGSPQSRIWFSAQSADRMLTQGVWDCSSGRFSWDFVWDEFVMILEGEAKITPETGESFTLRAGDFCHFPLGLKTVWQVDRYVRKTFTIRTQEPLDL